MSQLESKPEGVESHGVKDASVALSRDVQVPGTNLQEQKAERSRATKDLVNQGVLPDSGFLDTRTADSSIARDNPGSDDVDGAPLRADSSRSIDSAAAGLVEAVGDPEKQQRILDALVDNFGRENPAEPGSVLARRLNDALRSAPGGEALSVDFMGSEGIRDGSTTIRLFDRNDPEKDLASSNLSYMRETSPQELEGVSKQIREQRPDLVSMLSAPETLNNLVSSANEMIQAQISGKDPTAIFRKAAEDFSRSNPEAGITAFTSLMQGAIENNPHKNKHLMIGFAGGEALLMDPLRKRGERVLASADIGFGSN